jgi:hypothetical protein
MRSIGPARGWFILAAVLGIVAMFVLDGAAGGVVAAAAIAAFLIGAFRSLLGESPEDRTAGTGLFGGWF